MGRVLHLGCRLLHFPSSMTPRFGNISTACEDDEKNFSNDSPSTWSKHDHRDADTHTTLRVLGRRNAESSNPQLDHASPRSDLGPSSNTPSRSRSWPRRAATKTTFLANILGLDNSTGHENNTAPRARYPTRGANYSRASGTLGPPTFDLGDTFLPP